VGRREGGDAGAVVAGPFDHGGRDSYLVVKLRPGVTDAVGGGKVPLEQVEEGLVVGLEHAGVADVQAASGLQASGGLGTFRLATGGRGGRRGVVIDIQVDAFDSGGT